MYSGFQFYVCILSSRRTMSIAQDLISQIINTKDTCTRRRRKTFSKSRARFWLLLISSSQSNLAIYRSQWYISLMLICLGSWSKFAGYKWVNISLATKHISQSQGVSGMTRDGCIVLQRVGKGYSLGDHLVTMGPIVELGDRGADSVDNISIITRVICPSLGRHDAASSKHDTDTESLLHAWMSSLVYLFIFKNFI